MLRFSRDVPQASLALSRSFDFQGNDGAMMAQVREVRDAIREKVREFVSEVRGRSEYRA
jgi:hypothetical protein